MTTHANVVGQLPPATRPPAPARGSSMRSFSWSVRRELWENRAVYLAPLLTSGILVTVFALSTIGLPARRRAVLLLDPAQQRVHIQMPYDLAINMILLTVFLVWLFYCLDALHGERRDRSILFWKSMPVSDLVTVFSKASIPLLVLPAITFVACVATHSVMALLSTVVLRTHGLPAATAAQLPLLHSWGSLLYGLTAMTLWDAPLYAWLLLVSAWAKRGALLWAMLPAITIGIVEKILFGTAHFTSFVQYRGMGWVTTAFGLKPRGSLLIDPLNPLTPERFFSTPALWVGLLFAAVFLIAAARIRRSRGPL